MIIIIGLCTLFKFQIVRLNSNENRYQVVCKQVSSRLYLFGIRHILYTQACLRITMKVYAANNKLNYTNTKQSWYCKCSELLFCIYTIINQVLDYAFLRLWNLQTNQDSAASIFCHEQLSSR